MTFLYDIGRVLLDFNFERSLATLLPADAADGLARLTRLLEKKDEFEAGGISTEDYITWALQVMESTASSEDFCHAWRNIFTVNEPMWARVQSLAAEGHRLILFSNINGIHAPWIFEEYPQFSLFHGAVLSFEAGFIKPHPEIYEYAITTFDLIPEETLYIDDLPDNVATGRRLGFRTWQYDIKNHAAFENWLSNELDTLPS